MSLVIGFTIIVFYSLLVGLSVVVDRAIYASKYQPKWRPEINIESAPMVTWQRVTNHKWLNKKN